jgi:hypothetical protein
MRAVLHTLMHRDISVPTPSFPPLMRALSSPVSYPFSLHEMIRHASLASNLHPPTYSPVFRWCVTRGTAHSHRHPVTKRQYRTPSRRKLLRFYCAMRPRYCALHSSRKTMGRRWHCAPCRICTRCSNPALRAPRRKSCSTRHRCVAHRYLFCAALLLTWSVGRRSSRKRARVRANGRWMTQGE